ncbi:ATPase, AAA-type, core [Podospora australis]|uniref:ATPase, AAA-type, core n=1 Tax=Podospora australis TaxID=1536484 RepID=A0AAN6X0F0_9PEZI|nr:ATPase, AAA-type, core [Podospora australis]
MVEFGKRPEHRVYQRRITKKDREEDVLVDGLDAAYISKEQRENREYALVVWQVFNQKQRREKTILAVQSPFILRVFREVVKSHPAVPSTFEEPFEMDSPFQMLLHHWDDLEAHLKQTDDDDVRLHLGLLLDFMKSELGADRERLLTMIQKKSITYATLWSIFVPGQLLYLMDNGHPWLFRCVKTAYEEYSTRGKICHVYGQYTDFDGKLKGGATHVVDIRQKACFGGDNPASITSLPIFPLRFLTDSEEQISELKKTLTERGERFMKIKGVRFMYNNGLAQYLKEPPYSFYHWSLADTSGYWLPFTETGRIVLDRQLFDEEIALERKSIRKDDDAELMLCPPHAKGYSVVRKTWCRYYMDSLTEITWKEDSWATLMLGSAQKRILRALVESHICPDNARDQAAQKGKGCVILLHGSPGSGKTLTAETSADASRRLLITSSLDELNKDDIPSVFEYHLKRLLQYATRWKAVVLLDEADVFLEKRDDAPGGEKRNALVAVFLKHLEFFSGIVFLTTNRAKSFDPAMKSRLHLALEYKPPGIETRQHLWTQYLSAIPASEIDMDINEDIDELLPEKLNGREISYAVHTARTIARYEKQPLSLAHLRDVIQVRRDFDRSLQAMANDLPGPGTRTGTGTGFSRKDSILHNEAADYES